MAKLLPLYRVLIYGMYVLTQLCQFWDTFRAELGNEGSYQVSIGAMCLRLLELQESNDEAQKIRTEGLKNGYKEDEEILHH